MLYFDDEMNSQNEIKMGSCKTRRDSNIPSTFVSVSAISGTIENKVFHEGFTATPVGDTPRSISPELDRLIASL